MCFPLAEIGYLIILIIVGMAVFAILGVLIQTFGPSLLAQNYIDALVRICWIVFKALIAIAVVIIIINLAGCLLSYVRMPRLG